MQKSIYMSDLFAERIYPAFASTKKKPRTAADYFQSARMICDFCKKDFLSLTSEDAKAYYEYLKEQEANGKISNRTIKVRFVGFNQLARFVCAGYPEQMQDNPFENILLPLTEEHLKYQRIPSMKEIDDLLTAAKDDEQMYLILCLICRMGLTASETVKLRRQQIVEMDEGKIAIICTGKDGNELLRPVPEDVRDILLSFMEKNGIEAELFHNEWKKPLTERNLDYLIKKYSALAGIETKCSVKDLRNRAILSMLQANASPQEVAQYAGIGMVRVRQFVNEGNVIANCPADLVNFRIVKKDEQ